MNGEERVGSGVLKLRAVRAENFKRAYDGRRCKGALLICRGVLDLFARAAAAHESRLECTDLQLENSEHVTTTSSWRPLGSPLPMAARSHLSDPERISELWTAQSAILGPPSDRKNI